MTSDTASPGPSLKKRSTEGAILTLMQIGIGYTLRLATNLILTRLLAPEAFGLVVFAMTAITAFMLLSDIGISRSIVREKDGDSIAFLQTAWTVKIIRTGLVAGCTLVVALLAALLAPRFAPPHSVYADPALIPILAVSALLTFASGFDSTAVDLLQRRITYRRAFIVQLMVQVVQISATVMAAYALGSVWALMLGMSVGSFASLAASHLAYPGPRMAFRLDSDIVHRLWVFGRWIIVSSSLFFLQRNFDKLVLGALLSTVAFGHYAIAILWIEAGRAVLQALIQRIAYPAMSEVAITRRTDLPRLYRKLQWGVDAGIWIAFAATAFGAQLLMDLLYPDSYAASGHYLGLLSLACLAQRFDTIGELLTALGDSRAGAVAAAIRTVGLCLAMSFGWAMAGIDGLIICSALHPILAAPYMIWKARRHLPALRVSVDIVAFLIIGTVGMSFLFNA